jgi:baculoviral IAP repeat-containing protein 7/8
MDFRRPGLLDIYRETLNQEVVRLKTFIGWRVPFLNVNQLAKDGFYYTKVGDVIHCAFCSFEKGGWVLGDNPLLEHRKSHNACRHRTDLPATNVPIEGETGEPVNSIFEAMSSCHMDNIIGPPAHPAYATIEDRMDTYELWPAALETRPKTLSEAGFFYTGRGDCTICYHCGIGLKDWFGGDDPWEEHAKFFYKRKCKFVLFSKGKDFVDRFAANSDVDPGASSSSSFEAPIEAPIEVPPPPVLPVDTLVNDGRLCKICFADEMGMVFLPCGHIAVCNKCSLSLTLCIICRKPFTVALKVFLA